ncbi:uncharacterized protein Z518_11150 [Rhinocladiella mackenziei CBS 650.93]|uniref:Uncharacterized protein n=1 Tax=Rhinocladiella mackenziei CBS 650.93 TaxID=1442369 RepID=A0A0D2GMZ3_9EURO|nr:uncharacterized protein Z518_11150 [Rhinocladiella mackenziei CBS 650.93]KIW99737.1 hypothetical protein Z518_11150 [Rhinocladiella mackenziei CBS 650.93]
MEFPCTPQDSGHHSPSDDMDNRTSLWLERKRVIDRKAQKLSRVRAKAYVDYLEKTIERMSAGPNGNSSGTLARQLKEQYEQIERLQDIIHNTGQLSKGVVSMRHSSVGDTKEPAKPPNSISGASGSLSRPEQDEEEPPPTSKRSAALDYAGRRAVVRLILSMVYLVLDLALLFGSDAHRMHTARADSYFSPTQEIDLLDILDNDVGIELVQLGILMGFHLQSTERFSKCWNITGQPNVYIYWQSGRTSCQTDRTLNTNQCTPSLRGFSRPQFDYNDF